MHDPTPALTRQFLVWLAEQPRCYADVMAAWRTSCPRLSIWEDAVIDGLVAVGAGAPTRDAAPVTLTAKGRVLLDAPGDAAGHPARPRPAVRPPRSGRTRRPRARRPGA
ncbi:hypothetical protein [Rhodoplanes serenus]|uniref:hypothetical protein n=1 Tax=Rhodoplanes serenus TaxID=200615 RepID=UPI001AEC9793|nr:hypothetical protein [Rhodoplanes serenus]